MVTIYITFTDQNGRPLEIEYKVNLALLIMMRYSIKPRTRKYVKGYGFLSFSRNQSEKYGKKLLDTATNTGLHAAKPEILLISST